VQRRVSVSWTSISLWEHEIIGLLARIQKASCRPQGRPEASGIAPMASIFISSYPHQPHYGFNTDSSADGTCPVAESLCVVETCWPNLSAVISASATSVGVASKEWLWIVSASAQAAVATVSSCLSVGLSNPISASVTGRPISRENRTTCSMNSSSRPSSTSWVSVPMFTFSPCFALWVASTCVRPL